MTDPLIERAVEKAAKAGREIYWPRVSASDPWVQLRKEAQHEWGRVSRAILIAYLQDRLSDPDLPEVVAAVFRGEIYLVERGGKGG